MKTIHIKSILALAAVAVSAISFPSCKDDITETLETEAYIQPGAFYVVSAVDKNRQYEAVLSEDGSTFTIRVPQNVNAEEELNGAVPKFYLSMGAIVKPDITEPQNFFDTENPVIYTVTARNGGATRSYKVDYVIVEPTPIAFGELPASIDRMASATIGGDFGFNGDVIGTPAFCGLGHVAMFSRKYNTIRIYDLPSLAVSATQLKTDGAFDVKDVVAVTSDSKGSLVVAVGGKGTGHSKFYYYTAPDQDPVALDGETHTSVEYDLSDAAKMGTYISCTGDISGQAVIAFGGPRDDLGTHYKYYVSGGKLRDDYETIHTGYPSNDMSEFQMISFFSIKKNSPYLVGDCQKSDKGDADPMRNEVEIRVNDNTGNTVAQADYYAKEYNGWLNSWWQRTGQAMGTKGGRRPTVHAMNLNGNEFALFSTGGGSGAAHMQRTLITDKNLTTYYTNYGAFDGTWLLTFGSETAAPWIDYFTNGTGMACDWCFDDEKQQGYIAVWYERRALVIYEVSCIKML